MLTLSLSLISTLAITESMNGCSYHKRYVTVHTTIDVAALAVSSSLRISINMYTSVRWSVPRKPLEH